MTVSTLAEKHLSEFEQAATNLIGYFSDGPKENQDRAARLFRLISERAAAEAGYSSLVDLLESRSAEKIELALDFASLGFVGWLRSKDETEWLLAQSCGAVAVMCHYGRLPKPVPQGGILELIVDFYAAVVVAHGECRCYLD